MGWDRKVVGDRLWVWVSPRGLWVGVRIGCGLGYVKVGSEPVDWDRLWGGLGF